MLCLSSLLASTSDCLMSFAAAKLEVELEDLRSALTALGSGTDIEL